MASDHLTASHAKASEHASFFRQSGWLMIANIVAGAMMWAVHFLSKKIPDSEYSAFVTLLAVAMTIPTLPLQMVMAQQAARARAIGREGQLASILRLVLTGTILVWILGSLVVLVFQGSIVSRWQLANAFGLWITLPVLLLNLCLPTLWGVLQGMQSFLWLGWSMMLNGIGRILIALLVVVIISATAAGIMTGVLVGMALAAGVALWQLRSVLFTPGQSFEWRPLLAQVFPLMLGFAAFQFLFTADTLFAKAYFDKDTMAAYGGAGTMSRALMWLVGPLATVMFPRIVHSATKSEKSNLAGLVLAGTAVLAITGAVSLSLLGPWVIRFVYKESFVQVATVLLPWYSFAMVPLSLANVLLNNLLARGAFKMVPALCVLAVCYGFALTRFNTTFVTVIQTMGVCNVLLLLICAWYTWIQPPKAPSVAVS